MTGENEALWLTPDDATPESHILNSLDRHWEILAIGYLTCLSKLLDCPVILKTSKFLLVGIPTDSNSFVSEQMTRKLTSYVTMVYFFVEILLINRIPNHARFVKRSVSVMNLCLYFPIVYFMTRCPNRILDVVSIVGNACSRMFGLKIPSVYWELSVWHFRAKHLFRSGLSGIALALKYTKSDLVVMVVH